MEMQKIVAPQLAGLWLSAAINDVRTAAMKIVAIKHVLESI